MEMFCPDTPYIWSRVDITLSSNGADFLRLQIKYIN